MCPHWQGNGCFRRQRDMSSLGGGCPRYSPVVLVLVLVLGVVVVVVGLVVVPLARRGKGGRRSREACSAPEASSPLAAKSAREWARVPPGVVGGRLGFPEWGALAAPPAPGVRYAP